MKSSEVGGGSPTYRIPSHYLLLSRMSCVLDFNGQMKPNMVSLRDSETETQALESVKVTAVPEEIPSEGTLKWSGK